MKHKRMIPWALILVLAVHLLSGCDGFHNPTVPPTTAAPSESTHAPEPTLTQPPQTEAPVQTEVPTQPVQTEAAPPPTTEPMPVLLELSQEERHALNRFLSNFSEQWFHEGFVWYESPSDSVFYAADADITQIVGFAWLHAKINRSSELQVVKIGEDYYYSFDLDVLSPIAEQFFGRTVTGEGLPTTPSEFFFLLDGMVCSVAADGESYTNVTVTEQVHDLGDGTLRVEFTIYDAWAFSEFGEGASQKDVYALTGEEARNEPDLLQHRTGAAVLRPHTLEDGQKTYQLVSYELFTPAE